MNEQELKGAINSGAGAVERLTGRAIGDIGVEASGAVRQASGELQAKAGKAQAMIGDAAVEAYDRASARAREVSETVEPFIKGRPYAALGIAAGVGLILGVLLAGRGGKSST